MGKVGDDGECDYGPITSAFLWLTAGSFASKGHTFSSILFIPSLAHIEEHIHPFDLLQKARQ